MSDDDTWDLAFALPNLRLRASRPNEDALSPRFEGRHVGLAAYEDDRVTALKARSKAAKKILEGFVDNFGRGVPVSVLIYKATAPTSINLQAFTGFRNAVAISILLHSWTEQGHHGRLYSDVFDFYPTTVGADDRLVTHSAALRALFSEDAPFQAMPYAHVSPAGPMLWIDYYVHRALLHEWSERFEHDRQDSHRTALFRSLEVAYMACSTPVRNQASLTDWGVNIALWVSAIEILAHPHARGDKGQVGQNASLDLVGQYPWKSESLNELRSELTFGRGPRKITRQVNAIQQGCHELYHARHSFLHGNPVDSNTLFPFENVRISLIEVAPLVYRTALAAFLQTRVEPHRGFKEEEYEKSHPGYEHVLHMIGEDWRVERAARAMFGLADSNSDDGEG